ncbi:hypothetical protein KHS38_15400 [Mucilaginibacter sp. Bleaf8]|uniref:hypothetical protein n=1 Tax=Mucilaginibacter sp. Bleaf8 TaxID=2834430 RepID=UPI001BCB360C|nr:hypothetical protein [Mucilaginibacter sp. Bleaf8]MBS7565792.1 hypothetical protein [Mucilaginibacter sp. Bleaf8]
MKKNLLLIYPALALSLFFANCKKDSAEKMQGSEIITATKAGEYQKTFAQILAKAVNSDPALRKFLKEESLKQFDKDNDILYQVVKNVRVNNAATFHERLMKYAASEQQLIDIENELPLLTIFVPTLPNFSPNTWNAETEVPMVANSVSGNATVSIYDANNEEIKFKPSQIPGFPVLVIKQNERVVVKNTVENTASSSTKNTMSTSSTSGNIINTGKYSLSFANEAFNGLNQSSNDSKYGALYYTTGVAIDPINIQAYNTGNEWQRDYIYYGLSSSVGKGEFNNAYSEFLTYFKLSPDALGIIADQDDPKANSFYATSPEWEIDGNPMPLTMWTEGKFEFHITILINSKNGVGSELVKVLSVNPRDLYDLTYQQVLENKFTRSKVYQLTSIVPKEYHPNIELIPWDLQNYGTAWKFIVYEKDNAQEVTQSYENTTTYAANFSIEGTIKKVGLKFGASATTTSKTSYSIKTTLNSDFLGETIVTFDQPVITGSNGSGYNVREYTTGNLLTLGIEPKRTRQ